MQQRIDWMLTAATRLVRCGRRFPTLRVRLGVLRVGLVEAARDRATARTESSARLNRLNTPYEAKSTRSGSESVQRGAAAAI